MKICVAKTRPIKGEIDKNIEIHKKFIDLAISKGADMIFFSELSLTGYEPKLAKNLATTQDDTRFDDFQKISDSHTAACMFMRDNSSSVQTNCEDEQD